MNPTQLLIDELGNHLETYFCRIFGNLEPLYPKILNSAARVALEHISNSDALYHDVIHTIQVAIVGQEILRGRHLLHRVAPTDWFHFTLATLFHDIGYVRGVCSGDSPDACVIDTEGNTVTPPRGATDAFLAPYHVDRSKIFVMERISEVPYIDAERVANAIEQTRFPVPDSPEYQDPGSEGGLLRAADLIGQLADPSYLRKMSRLYYEFVESGLADQMGYRSAADLAEKYPGFFWDVAQPYLTEGVRFLQLTQEGKQWVANLHSHVFALEHDKHYFGPFRGNPVRGGRNARPNADREERPETQEDGRRSLADK